MRSPPWTDLRVVPPGERSSRIGSLAAASSRSTTSPGTYVSASANWRKTDAGAAFSTAATR